MEFNAAHIHLMVNHIPVLATLFSIPLFIWGMLRKQQTIKKVALVGFILAGLMVIVAVQSGESAEEIVESMPGVSEQLIHDHEEAAELAQWLTTILGVGAIGGFFLLSGNFKYSRQIMVVLLFYSLIVGGMLVYTANLGGKIMHPELSDTTAVQILDQDND